MPEVDSLDVKIAASAENAIKSLDTLIEKLNTVTNALKFDTGGIKNIGVSISNVSKSVETAMGGVDKSVDQSMQKAEKSTSTFAKKMKITLEDARKKVNDVWKPTDLVGRSRTSLEKMKADLQSQLTNRTRSKEADELAGTASGKTYNKNLILIAQLEKQIEEVGNRLKELSMPTQTEDEILKLAQNAVKARDSIRETVEETQRYGKAISNAAYACRNIVEEVEKISQTTANAQNAANGFKMPFISDKLTDAARSAMSLSDILKNLKVTSTSVGLKKVDETIKKTKEQYRQLGEQIEIAFKHNKNYGNTAAFDRQQIKIEQLQNQYRDLILMQRQLAQEQPYEHIRSALRTMGKAASTTASSVKSLAVRLKDTVKNVLRTHNASKQLKKTAQKLSKSLLRVTNMLKMMVIRMALRKVIEGVGTGFKGLALYSDEFNQSISMLISSLKQLGYSVSAMVGPLVNALAPALNQIIQMAINAVNAINQLISAVTGKGTWIRAKKQVDDFAKSVKGASSTAKNSTRVFDELKVISSDKGGSGSGSSDVDFGDMYETVDISKNILDFSDKIKDAWEKADFTEIGGIIGEKINKGLASIKWGDIQKTAENIGKSIGTLITGFVQTPDLGKNIGKSIAEAMNTAVGFIYSFLDSTEWLSVGIFVGDSITGFFETIDAEKIGNAIAEALNAAVSFLKGLGKSIKWDSLGESAANGVNGFLEVFDAKELADTVDIWVQGIETALTSAAKKINWKDVFAGIYVFFSNLDIETINLIVSIVTIKQVGKWVIGGGLLKGIGEKLFPTGITLSSLRIGISGIVPYMMPGTPMGDTFGVFAEDNIINPIATKILKLFPDDIGDALERGLAGAFLGAAGGTIIAPGVGTVVGAIVGGFVGELTSDLVWKNVSDAFTDVFNFDRTLALFDGAKFFFDKLKEDFEKKDWGAIGEDILGGILGGITGALSFITEPITDLFGAIYQEICNLFGIHSPSKEMEPIGKNIVEGILEGFSLVNFSQRVTDWWNKNVSPWFTLKKWADLGNNIKTSLTNKWNEFTNWFNNTGFAKWWNTVKEKFSLSSWTTFGNNIKTSITNKWNQFVTWFNGTGIGKWWNNVSQKFSLTSWTNFGNNIKTSLTNKWNEFTNWFNNTGFAKWWSGVKEKFSRNSWNLNGIKEGLSDAWNAAIDSIKGLWNKFAEWLNKKLEIKIDTDSIIGKGIANVLGTDKITLGKIPTFAQGGFPEDGWFRASRGEIMGKFDNGKSVVANNSQIIQGIADGIYPAVYNAVSSAIKNNSVGTSNQPIRVFVGDRELTDIVVDGITRRTVQNQKTPFPVMI